MFLDKLTKKILGFITTTEQEHAQLKNKITRDLQTVERNTEDKVKTLRKTVEENSQQFEEKVDAQVELMQEKLKGVEAKLAKMDESEVLMEFIN